MLQAATVAIRLGGPTTLPSFPFLRLKSRSSCSVLVMDLHEPHIAPPHLGWLTLLPLPAGIDRAIAGLWTAGKGYVRRQTDDQTMFIPQVRFPSSRRCRGRVSVAIEPPSWCFWYISLDVSDPRFHGEAMRSGARQ